MNQCPNCKIAVDSDAKFCKNCAAPVGEAVNTNMPYGNTRSKKKGLVIGGIALAILLVAGGITAILLNSDGPTKERCIQVLKDILIAHNSGDYEKAMSYFRNDETEKDYKQAIRTGSTPRKLGLSTEQIDALAEKGKLTSLTDYIDSQRPKIANIPPDFTTLYGRKYNVPVENCYVLSMGGKGIAFYWDGKDLKLIASVDPHDKAGDFNK